jgi:hypothetical protein
MSPRRRTPTFACVLVIAGALAPTGLARAAQPVSTPPSDAEVAAGIRQVKEGDFETAVVTLQSAARRLAVLPRPPRDLLQAHLYLGVAHVALDHAEPARERFREVLTLEPDLRLSPDEFSPKVIGAFELARRDMASTRVSTAPAKRGSRAPWIIGGVVAGAAGIAAVAAAGGDGGGPTGSASFSGARFATPVLVCEDGARMMPLPFALFVDGVNSTSRPVTVSAVTVVLTIVASSIPSEIGFGSSFEATVMPDTVAANGRAMLRIDSTLRCDNGVGDSMRFNEWSGQVTITSSAGVSTLAAVDRLRINIP